MNAPTLIAHMNLAELKTEIKPNVFFLLFRLNIVFKHLLF